MRLSFVTFNNDAKPPPKWILREFDVSWIRPRLGGLPHLETGLADRDTSPDGSPHLSRKRDQIKMRDYMDRRITPPKRVTSPTWGPPALCKQALSATWKNSYHFLIEFIPLASFSNWGFLGFCLFAKFQTHKTHNKGQKRNAGKHYKGLNVQSNWNIRNIKSRILGR